MAQTVSPCPISFLTTNELIGESQYGSLKHRSYSSRHFDVFDLVTLKADKKKANTFIFLCTTKALCRMSHEGILLKIKSHGSTDPLCFWLNFYLSDQSHISSINGPYSNNSQLLAV